mmetsp:Transcript_97920/g.204235  ORF Transcript_97920/g.204235 Transcript_97920/m.204235 type:complete len:324 (+) Transcript_97920:2674-3645(+)
MFRGSNRQVQLTAIVRRPNALLMQFGQISWIDEFEGQQFEDVKCALCDVASASEDRHEGAECWGQSMLPDGIASQANRALSLVKARVHEGRSNVEEGSTVPQCQEPLAQTPKKIDCSSIACKVTKRHEALVSPSAALGDALVVHEAHLLLKNCIQERHATCLGLDCVRKKQPRSAGKQQLDRHLLDSSNGGALGEVFLQNRPGLLVLVVSEDAPGRWLNNHFDAFLHQFLNMPWRQRCPAFPFVLVLATDSQHTRNPTSHGFRMCILCAMGPHSCHRTIEERGSESKHRSLLRKAPILRQKSGARARLALHARGVANNGSTSF